MKSWEFFYKKNICFSFFWFTFNNTNIKISLKPLTKAPFIYTDKLDELKKKKN